MPRRRFRDPDPQVRDRNMLDILGAPGLSGLSRVGGLSGGSQTASLVVRGGREGGEGVQVEHVTLEAVASQTIGSGGGTVQWDTVRPAPTEVRGFDTLQTDLASAGVVGDIPIDVTGVLKFILDGRWASWRATGMLTVTHIRGAFETPREYDLSRTVATREFGGVDDGFEVMAGDLMRYELSNGSGSAQTLAEATLLQLVRAEAQAASRDYQVDTIWFDTVDGSATGSAVLDDGVSYRVEVHGNMRRHPTEDDYTFGDPDAIIYPSDSPGSTGDAGHDYDTTYASADGVGHGHNSSIELNVGAGWSHVEPRGGPYSTPTADHRYTVDLVGTGAALQIRDTDTPVSDNNGQIRFDVYRGS